MHGTRSHLWIHFQLSSFEKDNVDVVIHAFIIKLMTDFIKLMAFSHIATIFKEMWNCRESSSERGALVYLLRSPIREYVFDKKGTTRF